MCRSMCCASGKAASRRSSRSSARGGRRYYRPEDVDLLRGIRALLYSDGFTIKGVQKLLREQGVRYVADLGRADCSLIRHLSETPADELPPKLRAMPARRSRRLPPRIRVRGKRPCTKRLRGLKPMRRPAVLRWTKRRA